MKRLSILVLLGAALLGGCASKEFSSTPFYSGDDVKFTGPVEERVNLWPLGYWREPVGSVVWPLISFGDDHFAFRPIYSMYKQKSGSDAEYDEFNFVWPISQFDTKGRDYRIFPFFWGKDHGGDLYFSLFPLLFTGDDYFTLFPAFWWVENEFAGVFPFFWSLDSTPDSGGFAVFPLFWSETISNGDYWNTLFPLYYIEHEAPDANGRRPEYTEFWALAYLAGFETHGGKFTHHRFLPFYFTADDDFISLPYSRYEEGGLMKQRFLAGLGGWNTSTNGEYASSWAFPLYYHDTNKLITPLFGKTRDAAWLFPLFYHEGDSFVTPLYGKSGDADWLIPLYYRNEKTFLTPLFGKSDDAYWLLPLFYKDDYEFISLLGAGGKTSRDTSYSWLFPLYYWEEDDGFYSLLYSRKANGQQNFIWFLAGTQGGAYKGGWLLPFFFTKESEKFELHDSWLELEELPPEIEITQSVATNWVWDSKLKVRVQREEPKINAPYIYSQKTHNYLILSEHDRFISSYIDYDKCNGSVAPLARRSPCSVADSRDEAKSFVLQKIYNFGNPILLDYNSRQCRHFDLNTRKKMYDDFESSASFLMLLYRYEHEEEGAQNHTYTRHSILWKLWDWEEIDGDVSLDVFPAFTYDSKKNGYTKTSFFWRLFRYESDPEEGTAVDFLFIPVWR